MESLKDYLKRLDDCIEYAKYTDSYNKDIVEFLEELKRIQRPKEYHSCNDINCIICGSGIE